MSVNEPKSLWRMQTSSGIPAKLIKRYGGFSRSGAEATEEYIIKSEDLLNFVLTGLPTPAILASGGVEYPGRAVFYGIPSLVVDNISFESLVDGKPIDPFGHDAVTTGDATPPEGTYEENLKCIVKYKPRERGKDNEDSNPNDPFSFLQISSNASGEFLAPPISGEARWQRWQYNPFDGTWSLGDSGEVEEVNIPSTVISPLTEWTVRWPQIPYNYFYYTVIPKLRAMIGTVNSLTNALLHHSLPQTSLFVGYSTNEEYLWDLGSVLTPPISLELKFLEKNFIGWGAEGEKPNLTPIQVQVTHQHMYRPGVGWEVIAVAEHLLYQATDHNQIWAP